MDSRSFEFRTAPRVQRLRARTGMLIGASTLLTKLGYTAFVRLHEIREGIVTRKMIRSGWPTIDLYEDRALSPNALIVDAKDRLVLDVKINAWEAGEQIMDWLCYGGVGEDAVMAYDHHDDELCVVIKVPQLLSFVLELHYNPYL